jgi:DNA-binding winged helix-turn-helix (wHTH) protein/TolB-like protein
MILFLSDKALFNERLTETTDLHGKIPATLAENQLRAMNQERAPIPSQIFRFGLFEADVALGTLTRKGVRVKIQDQPFRVLVTLLERPGEIVTREELRQKLWKEGTYVDFDGGLNVTLKKLRAALDDESDNPRFIETVPRRGYRFIAPVTGNRSASELERVEPPQIPHRQAPRSVPAIAIIFGRIWLWASIVVLAILVFLGWRFRRKEPVSVAASQKVIAVLPFSNEGAGADFDYLRYAIANDLVTDLAHAHSVSVRPFSSTSRFATQPGDPAAIGEQLRVTHVVAGGFLLDKMTLRINIELVDVAQNLPVWRDEISVPSQELIALHDKLAVYATQGMLPAIQVRGASPGDIPVPKNEHALELFLHSLSISYDPEPNLVGIKQLEDSVSIEGDYAPAWAELSRRYSYDFHYGKGGRTSDEKSRAAYKRQFELDPNWPSISTAIRVEDGDLNGAYDQGADFLRRHPDLAEGHFYMSYDLLYAGLLEEAGEECEAAHRLDPGDGVLRACAVPFILQGDYARAKPYIQLEEHSGFGAMLRMTIALRSGNRKLALNEADAASRGGFRFAGLARVCLNHSPEAERHRAAAALEVEPVWRDPEMFYFNAAVLSFCDERDAALRQLRNAITGNYCSFPAFDKDPLFDPIRLRPEFADLRQSAMQCQRRFLAHREQTDRQPRAGR